MSSLSLAELTGHSETFVTRDNREFRDKDGIEQRLSLKYGHQPNGVYSALSLGLRERDGVQEGHIYQFYLEKKFAASGSAIRAGRFEQSDSLGFYTLDGVRGKLSSKLASLVVYHGVPRRIEGLRSVEGESVSGADIHLHEQNWGSLSLDGLLGWQELKQEKTSERMNVAVKTKSTDTSSGNGELFILSVAGTWLADENLWESYQLNLSTQLGDDARMQLDYETYEPAAEVLSFRDRYYLNYEKGRQSQSRGALHFNTRGRHNWSLSGRQIERESGDTGYGQAVNWLHRDGSGTRLEAQLDRLVLDEDSMSGLYLEMRKPLSAQTRTVLGGVWQQQTKHLAGDNTVLGIEARLERMLKIEAFGSGLMFSGQVSYIQNSRLTDEYRIALGLTYRFNDQPTVTAQ